MDNNKDDFSDVMIPYVEFAENANERTPCILVLDCSGSMRGEPIKQLNTGLQALEKELKEDIDASSRVQLLVIKAYGKDDAEISADWVDAMNFTEMCIRDRVKRRRSRGRCWLRWAFCRKKSMRIGI